ncbi:hypothetical protein HMPREF0653_01669 [Prevotella disiens JCM 6334 = ATCC 29426]|uniref:Uncharacterized protein n=2 Tax=Prevotella disiens TaxID=28130 RepID=A0A379DWR0_9BACT|nr:hypothetical protein [Prevotella disiens]ERJ75992.1 hypothetical protein HMPREF0653_01669 [Prevotella disiens JCM 6334 = ATCC 29426]SUB84907.1 Uncharacterised protein [Prevotella disiens]
MEKNIINEFEQTIKDDLYQYLLLHKEVDERLPEAPDLDELWVKIVEAYMPDAIREFPAYPTVALGWIMYVGMALAKYWDEDWALYSKVENLYAYLRDQTDFDHTDDYIREKVLLLSADEAQSLEQLVGECAARTYNKLRRLNVEPGTKEAFKAFVAALHQLYNFGVAMELKRLGYKMTAIQ